jgi:hypothetical protein
MSSPAPLQDSKSSDAQQSRDSNPRYTDEKQHFTPSSPLPYSPVAIPGGGYQFWAAELPTPTLSPVDASDFQDPDSQLPQWDISRELRDANISRSMSLPMPAPRRRSYNKNLSIDGSMGIEVNEEIMVAAEGWRRHTRVYGGGVCQACLESEQAQAQMQAQAQGQKPATTAKSSS